MPETLSEYLVMAVQYLSPGAACALALVALLACFALYCAHSGAVWSLSGRTEPLSFVTPRAPMTKLDAKLCLALTLLYALTAFFRLGSFSAPQSTLDFVQSGPVTARLSQPVRVTSFRYFPSLGTGAYDVQAVDDQGRTLTLWPRKDDSNDPDKVTGWYWTETKNLPRTYAMSQGYNTLFKWTDLPIDNPQYLVTFTLTPRIERDTLQLAELALYTADADGQNAGRVSLSPSESTQAILVQGADELFDEQSTVPAQPTWYHSSYFDEIYHPRTALEHMENFHPYETTHPPLGKLIIGLGIRLFGMTPFGWRFMGTLFGVLMLPLLYVFLKEFFGKTLLAACGTILFAADFMHLTQTRIATIDTYAVFFILGAYFFLWRWLSQPADAPFRAGVLPLFLSGLFFGIGAACKWTVLYAGAGMALLYLINLILRFRALEPDDRPAFYAWAGKTILISILFFVLIPACIYTLSYWPYAVDRGTPTLKGLIDVMLSNQTHMFTYHQGVTTPHPYQSKWWMWLLDVRPILYYMSDGVDTHTRFAAFLNPLICWGGLVSLVLLLPRLHYQRDGRALFVLIGYLSQLVPWIPIARPTFNYHYFPSVPFLVLALCCIFDALEQAKPPRWRRWVVGLTALGGGLYLMFYPVLIGLTIPTWYSTFLRWLPTWPF